MGYIAIVDYDMGNLHSVCKGVEKMGAKPVVSDRPSVIQDAQGIILPGVGAFDPAMQHLNERGLGPVLKTAIAQGVPFLGICLGMQILLDGSEEGQEPGLGIIRGRVKRFKPEPGLTIPHMGWNDLHVTQPACPLWANLPDPCQVYFVHSYYVDPLDPATIAATVTHGHQTVPAAIAQGNLMAVQFHPEKSAETGLGILGNFLQLVAQCAVA